MKLLNFQSVILTALAAASLGLSACDDGDVAVGADVVAAGAYGDCYYTTDCGYQPYYGGDYYGVHGRRYRDGGEYGGGFHGGGDHGGNFHGGGDHGGGFHGGGRGPHSVDSQVAVTDAPDARVQTVANKYQISNYAGTYIVRAIVKAQSKDVSGITDLGLTADDFETVYSGGTLPDAKIDILSKKLMMDPRATSTLVEQLTKDVQAARN
jgi:hypothetical protein